ncbi:hypothetical protein CRES_1924 [Corynebacterium resistens DSM 45100]|uniref:Oxidoreductase n=1 Tax=Corynebacterium resistens (strain DSM 45100 / JCM 12819 / GTC 2026 / SICGH 158) TaxID=662755 RepID=F8E2Q4_CORRG|nr:DoxX family protein [Corynebacterium resistens]AEI10277.1 hypothetical protein CRES_1924 [Corynebacterium resistens DSM 45100]
MSTTSTQSPHPLRSISALIGRIILGGVLIAHGLQKLNTWGPDQTASSFDQMGVPMPEISAQIATWVELVGGILIVLGLLVRFVGPIIFIQMLGAAIFAHRSHGVFVGDGGWELVGVIGAAGLLLAASGAGAFSLDHLFMAPFRARRARKQQEHEQEMVASTPSLNNHLHQGPNAFSTNQASTNHAPTSQTPINQTPASQAPISQTPNNQPTPQKRGPIGQFDKPDSPRTSDGDDTATKVFPKNT